MEDGKGSIKAIDKTTVHRICSGQVVLNLAVAVKELVENSIDAGATVVDVRLKDYGIELLEVSDNGYGVHPDNFEGLTLKHHTSKLRDFSDLIGVETYGFRGEALSSLCALSDLSVATRHNSLDYGTEINFDHNGHILLKKHCARQIGTTICLANLFASLPVRQKEFHKNIKREFNKMTHLLYAYCLVSTGVKITCVNQTPKGSKTTFVATHGCKSVKENIASVFGSKQLNSLLEVKQHYPPNEVLEELKLTISECDVFNIFGYVSSCAHGMGRSTNDRQFYFINSRPCEPTKVIKVVNEIYHQYNMQQSPFVYLNISVAKESVDVNVTPDKRQIFLNHEKLLIAIVKASLLKIFQSIPSTFGINNVPVRNQSLPINVGVNEDSSSAKRPNISLFSQWRSGFDSKRKSNEINVVEPKKFKVTEQKQTSKQITLKSFTKKSNEENPQNIIPTEPKITANIQDETIDSKPVIKIEYFQKSADTVEQSKSCEAVRLESELCEEAYKGVQDLNSFSENDKRNVEEEIADLSDEGVSSQNVIQEKYALSDLESEEISDSQESGIDQDIIENPRIPVCDSYVERNKKFVIMPMNIESIKDLIQKRDKNVVYGNKSKSIPNLRFRANIDPSKNEIAEQELSKEISKDMFAKMNIIGQFNLGFIITKLDSDLFIIDQHASDEKYNFETLQKTTVISHQKLVVPQQLDLTAANENVLLDNIEIFRKNGFDFSINEEAAPTKRVCLTAVPMSRNWVFGKEDVDELIFMLEDSPHTDCRPSRVRSMFASRACRKSVMIGSALSMQEMKRLVGHMGEIEQPWNCPHGRPTMRHLINIDLIRDA